MLALMTDDRLSHRADWVPAACSDATAVRSPSRRGKATGQ